jgi:hypothetical protein
MGTLSMVVPTFTAGTIIDPNDIEDNLKKIEDFHNSGTAEEIEDENFKAKSIVTRCLGKAPNHFVTGSKVGNDEISGLADGHIVGYAIDNSHLPSACINDENLYWNTYAGSRPLEVWSPSGEPRPIKMGRAHVLVAFGATALSDTATLTYATGCEDGDPGFTAPHTNGLHVIWGWRPTIYAGTYYLQLSWECINATQLKLYAIRDAAVGVEEGYIELIMFGR